MKLQHLIVALLVVAGGFFLQSDAAKAVDRLRGAVLKMETSAGATSGYHEFSFSTKTGGAALDKISFQYCNTASATCATPNGLNTGENGGGGGGAVTLTSQTNTNTSWTISGADTNANTITVYNGTPDTLAANTYVTFRFGGVLNPYAPAAGTGGSNLDCVENGTNASAETCFVRINTYAGVTNIDTTTVSMTIVSAVTVSATVDPTFTFIVQGVDSNHVTNGITTSVSSTFSSLPFGNLTAGTPKYAAHQLNVSTNTVSGYRVSIRVTTQMTGVYSANNIDELGNGGTWSAPADWSEPNGGTANTNTGWLGANTSNAGLTQFKWTNFGPVQVGTENNVMSSNVSDNGATPTYVSYALEANVYQPADTYTGTIIYNALPTY